MGQHSVPEEPPPPKDKPRYRFLIAIGGIVALAFVTMAIVAALFPENAPAVAGPDQTAASGNPFPPLPTVDGVPPTNSVTGPPPATNPPVTSAGATTTPKATVKPRPSTSATAPVGNVIASYAVQTDWGSRFEAWITLTNNATTPQAWEFHLAYPANVTSFVTAWINGHDAPELTDATMPEVVLHSSSKLSPGASLTVRVQFDKSGTDFAPSLRTVNGRAF